ncbi:hypothetical protein PI23P_10710 [Polaribacter irgensii 23-P]|uniref:Uncharacterized protein n=1 Tax=Polaribacter irgensii 23-P TaxID=313594 RepID=A4C101_9FLAO|nr:hypothetical protein PI23P_10710 [Polaribacter irgensii 23-P]
MFVRITTDAHETFTKEHEDKNALLCAAMYSI